MTTPQDSPRRRKQKARRTKQLDEWRLKKATAAGGASKSAEKAAPKKAAPKKTEKSK
jgi:hypothetical protein